MSSPPGQPYSDRLQKRIAEKIEALKAMEHDSPSVIIVHDLIEISVRYMSARGLKILGVTFDELKKIGADYHPRFFNMEYAESYVPKILGLLERNNNEEIISYVQQVRARPSDSWKWYLSCTKIFMRDDAGKPLLVITNAIPLAPGLYIDAPKAKRLMEENAFLRKNHLLFNTLTRREKEILRMLAMGESSGKLAKKLHISTTTVSTHRRNIKRKLKIRTNYDITRFAQAFDLI